MNLQGTFKKSTKTLQEYKRGLLLSSGNLVSLTLVLLVMSFYGCSTFPSPKPRIQKIETAIPFENAKDELLAKTQSYNLQITNYIGIACLVFGCVCLGWIALPNGLGIGLIMGGCLALLSGTLIGSKWGIVGVSASIVLVFLFAGGIRDKFQATKQIRKDFKSKYLKDEG